VERQLLRAAAEYRIHSCGCVHACSGHLKGYLLPNPHIPTHRPFPLGAREAIDTLPLIACGSVATARSTALRAHSGTIASGSVEIGAQVADASSGRDSQVVQVQAADGCEQSAACRITADACNDRRCWRRRPSGTSSHDQKYRASLPRTSFGRPAKPRPFLDGAV
jgi:hypothetical protein